MGGNVIFHGQKADRIPINAYDLHNGILDFLWKNHFWNGRSFECFSGTTYQCFAHNTLLQEAMGSEKGTIGDIDLKVDREQEKQIENRLKTLVSNKSIIGYKKSGNQFILLVELMGINIQIDLEMCEFVDGVPTEWEIFARWSDLRDIKHGIKGVAHKLLLRALNAPHVRKMTVRKKGIEIESFDSFYSLSVFGFAIKYFEGADGCCDLIPTKKRVYIKSIDVIMKKFFDVPWFMVRKLKLDFYSFIGMCELIRKYVPLGKQQAIFWGFYNSLLGESAQMIYQDTNIDIFHKRKWLQIYQDIVFHGKSYRQDIIG